MVGGHEWVSSTDAQIHIHCIGPVGRCFLPVRVTYASDAAASLLLVTVIGLCTWHPHNTSRSTVLCVSAVHPCPTDPAHHLRAFQPVHFTAYVCTTVLVTGQGEWFWWAERCVCCCGARAGHHPRSCCSTQVSMRLLARCCLLCMPDRPSTQQRSTSIPCCFELATPSMRITTLPAPHDPLVGWYYRLPVVDGAL